VLPVAPGGTSDTLARMLGPKLTERMGQAIVNRQPPRRGGNIAAENRRQKLRPDGYTLFIGNSPMLTDVQEACTASSRNDPIDDFASIRAARHRSIQSLAITTLPLPAKSVSEFVALQKRVPADSTSDHRRSAALRISPASS